MPTPPQAYQICSELDFVSEMVFLLGRMGNNKKALTVIIERLGDVHRVTQTFFRDVVYAYEKLRS